MPRPPDTSWGFDAVIDFMSSDTEAGLPETPSPLRPSKSTTYTAKSSSITLGDFAGLFKELGISLDNPISSATLPEPALGILTETNNPDSQDDVVPSLVDDLGESGDADDSLEDDIDLAVKPAEDPYAGMSKTQRKRARRKAREPEPDAVGVLQKKIDSIVQHSAEIESQAAGKAGTTLVRPGIQSHHEARSLLPAIPITSRRQSAAAPITILQRSPIDKLNNVLSTQYIASSQPLSTLR